MILVSAMCPLSRDNPKFTFFFFFKKIFAYLFGIAKS